MGAPANSSGALQNELASLRGELATAWRLESELRQAQGALVESRRALATLLSNLPGIAYRCRNDERWTMEFVSEGCRALTGYDPADLHNSRTIAYADLIVPVERPRVWAAVQAGLRARAPFQMEYRIRARDGRQKWVWEQGCGVFTADGSLIAIEGFITDITDAKRAAEQRVARFARLARFQGAIVQLATGGALYSGEIEAAAHAITQTAVEALGVERVGLWRFTAAHDELFCVTTYSRAEQRHGRCPALHIQSAGRFLTELLKGGPVAVHHALGDERTREIVDVILEPLGLTSLLCAPVRLNGDIVAELCVGHAGPPHEWEPEEISFACELADHAAHALLHSERLRDETRRRALEQRVQHAQRLESLGVLAGGIAHDFNNLLTGMLGYASLAELELPPDSPARNAISQINTIAQQASELTRQLLAYAGHGKTTIENLNVAELAADVSRVIASRLSANAELECHLAADVPLVRADPVQLRQVVLNLLMNASEALEGGAGRITLAARPAEVSNESEESADGPERLAPGRYVCLEVADTGCGMDADTQEHIFDPFFSTKSSGHGLGLAAVQGIVRGHGGAIHVESAVGQGTTFQVFLPVTITVPVAPAPPTPAPAKSILPEYHSATVLVVDAEAAVRNLASSVLQRVGHSVHCAASGEEAIERIQKRGTIPELLIVDLDLPRQMCERVVQALRDARPEAGIVLMSGYADVTAPRIVQVEAAAILLKPFVPGRLTDCVQRVLGVNPDC